MKDWSRIKERYLRDDLRVRLGGLAANLARVASFSDHAGHRESVEDLLTESKLFIEWTAGDASMGTQVELMQLQVQLARWHVRLDQDWPDEGARSDMAGAARQWSNRLLGLSGLLRQKETVGLTFSQSS
jgi:hypothetical protein